MIHLTPVWGHIRVHIFNRPISDEPSKSTKNQNQSPCEQLLSNWSTNLTVLHMIGQSKMTERLHDMTPNGIRAVLTAL